MLCAATAPVIAGLGYIFAKDRYHKEPLIMLLGAFFIGVISVIPICLVEGTLDFILYLYNSQPGPLLFSFWNAFIVAACTEECFKMYFLHRHIWKSRDFDERFDGIVYGVFVSMGFACAENIQYIFSSLSEQGIFSAFQTSALRAVFSIPCHFFCGVILGYYLCLAKFENVNNDRNAQNFILKGLFFAILFHGIYDFILFYNSSYYASIDKTDLTFETCIPGIALFIFFIVFNIQFWKHGRKKIDHMASLLRPNSSEEQSAFITCSVCGKTYASNLNACPGCRQLTEKTLLAQNNRDSDWERQDLHNLNKFTSNRQSESPNKNPFDL